MSKFSRKLKNAYKCPFWVKPIHFSQPIKPIFLKKTLQINL